MLSVEGAHLRVQRVEGGDTTTVAMADVYRLPPERHDVRFRRLCGLPRSRNALGWLSNRKRDCRYRRCTRGRGRTPRGRSVSRALSELGHRAEPAAAIRARGPPLAVSARDRSGWNAPRSADLAPVATRPRGGARRDRLVLGHRSRNRGRRRRGRLARRSASNQGRPGLDRAGTFRLAAVDKAGNSPCYDRRGRRNRGDRCASSPRAAAR